MTSPGISPFAAAKITPRQQPKRSPCCDSCATGADVRAWISVVAQRRKLGLSDEEAFSRAWALIVDANPFPASLGRICPHPCEANCNRADKDGGIAVNAMERFLGDWALARRLTLPRIDGSGVGRQSIGVIGAGPAGLSFAYQLARRGYPVTVYEKESNAGGMLQHGIPPFRLPRHVIDAEVQRILDLGVELRVNAAAGRDISWPELKRRHDVLFLGIGAGRGLRLGLAGEEGPDVWTGIDYLARVNRGEHVEVGLHVVVVGGGNTAVDVARTARRAGARATMLYRRSRIEMPAAAGEIEDAIAEGVHIELLAAPVRIERDDGRIRAVVVQRMALGEPDSSGRRSPVPIQGDVFELPADTVIAAVSQAPDWEGLDGLPRNADAIRLRADGELADGVWTGGDVVSVGIAGAAIRQGRSAAEALHARLSGGRVPVASTQPLVMSSAVKRDYYADGARAARTHQPAAVLLTQPELEVEETISEAQFLHEAERCLSCGSCFGCEQCFTYCNARGFLRLTEVRPGAYYALDLSVCESCGKCIEVCPCGFLSPA